MPVKYEHTSTPENPEQLPVAHAVLGMLFGWLFPENS